MLLGFPVRDQQIHVNTIRPEMFISILIVLYVDIKPTIALGALYLLLLLNVSIKTKFTTVSNKC